MKKKELKLKYNLSERLFWKLISEERIFRIGYRDYEIDEVYFSDFSVDKYWKDYSKREDVVERRKLTNQKRSISMKEYYAEKTLNK